MTTTDTSLRQRLGGELPAGLAQLPAADQARLAALIDGAQRQQQDALRDALEGALRYIPALLRGTVRRILFPEARR